MLGMKKGCYMNSTVIDSKDFLITSDRDESVEEFYADENRKLAHLPVNIGEKFPSLIFLYADACAIMEVSKDNFKGLGKLRRLNLDNNHINQIDDDTFEYIPTVEEIHLAGNKIKNLNGRAFASLHKLTRVYLRVNACINQDFKTASKIAQLSRVVSERCGFDDNESFVMKNAKLEAELKTKSDELEALMLDIAKLKTEKAQAESQLAHHDEIKAHHQAHHQAHPKEDCEDRGDRREE